MDSCPDGLNWAVLPKVSRALQLDCNGTVYPQATLRTSRCGAECRRVKNLPISPLVSATTEF